MPATIALYTKTGGKSATKFSAPKALFGVKVSNFELLKRAYLAGEGNARHNLASTKTRAEVRGGGRKPWAQKGTGRARAGSNRSPIWRGGGITFGPRGVENYSLSLNKTAKVTALTQALSLAADAGRVSVIDDFVTNGKTASAAKLLKKLDFDRGLIVTEQSNEDTVRSLKNLPNIELTSAQRLNAAALLRASKVLMTKPAVVALESRIGAKS